VFWHVCVKFYKYVIVSPKFMILHQFWVPLTVANFCYVNDWVEFEYSSYL
jgi:hypothetical protein